MALLSCTVVFLLWLGCTAHEGTACEDPPVIDFGEIISGNKSGYMERDRVQYMCNAGYALSGSEWVTCHEKIWVPRPPQCLAPCIITKQQLEVKNLLLSNRQRHSFLILSGQWQKFMCMTGFNLTASPTRKCFNGHIELPSCVSGQGGKCGPPPAIENGDLLSFPRKEYPQGTTLEYKCPSFYVLEGSQHITCADGQWTSPPVCLAACTASEEDMSSNNIEPKVVQGRKLYARSGDFIEFQCRRGYVKDPTSSPLTVQCVEGMLEYPWCTPGRNCILDEWTMKENNIQLQSSGSSRLSRMSTYRSGDYIDFECQRWYQKVSRAGSLQAECLDGEIQYPTCQSIFG